MIVFTYISLITMVLSIVLAIGSYAQEGKPAHVFVGMGWLFITLTGIAALYWR